MYAFDYHRPASLAEVARLLASREDAKLLAGGQTLLPTLRQRLAQPTDLVDLAQVDELRGLRAVDDGLLVGAMTTHHTVSASPVARRVIPALAELAGGIGDPQVRNRGTLGGSIANNDPAADYPAALLALGATVRTNKRAIRADAFFTGLFETALDPGELVTAVQFTRPDRARYLKLRSQASRYATAGVFVATFGTAVRVAVTGAGACVFRWTDAERALAADFRPDVIDGLTLDPGDLNGDIHASAEYRAHLVKVLVRRAVNQC
ncbi:xanthine dehydrogenase family protein subunit M [Aerophototrophica crusticola]|uniref:Xanthine dehydrogenase family protein subunit M n=1 Tax=Aerophototrophica crusticola TaxID=1709002 RepID=A0A858R5Y3_9PROT|nr:xanthine dehydrogenase family protein subunit M [Rhodospirillaceae bacterium B3]